MQSECLVCWSVEEPLLISAQGTGPSSGEGKGADTHITSFGLDLMGILVKTANGTPKPKCRLGMVKLGLRSNPQEVSMNTCWNLPKTQTHRGTWGHKNSGMILQVPHPQKMVTQ